MVSDVEKTIVDIATYPQFCGGIVALGDAIIRLNKRVDPDKLSYYLARNMNKGAKRRILYLTDLLGIDWPVKREVMLRDLGAGVTLLDPSQPANGKKRVKLGLRLNMKADQMDQLLALHS
jgi:predicted transcriptional regulator of viral defense system